MENLTNLLQNNALATLAQRAPTQVLSSIKDASAKTGASFAYLLETAQAESSFRTDLKAKTSSATGLFQFIESTWLSMVDRYGDKHGIDTEGKSRGEILEMRKDPAKASVMAAEFASENERTLNRFWGGDVGSTELYLAHFLGAGSASSFLKARDENPMKIAADLFPAAAKANYNVFYDRQSGQARTVEGIYQFFDKKFTDVPEEITKPSVVDTVSRSYQQPVARAEKPVSNPYATKLAYYQLIQNPIELMLMAQLEIPFSGKSKSLF